LNPLSISIDRQARKWAVFDGFTCVHGFISYDDEAQALTDAKAEAARRGTPDAEVTYPRIDSIRVTYSRRKSRRGFILLEVLIVLAIVGIVVAIAADAIFKARDRDRDRAEWEVFSKANGCQVIRHEAAYWIGGRQVQARTTYRCANEQEFTR